jgi:hypothetical protein
MGVIEPAGAGWLAALLGHADTRTNGGDGRAGTTAGAGDDAAVVWLLGSLMMGWARREQRPTRCESGEKEKKTPKKKKKETKNKKQANKNQTDSPSPPASQQNNDTRLARAIATSD